MDGLILEIRVLSGWKSRGTWLPSEMAVTGFGIGDRVMSITGGGAYAEYARLDYRMAMPIPDGLDYVHAAAIPEDFVTAHEDRRMETNESIGKIVLTI